MSAEERIAELKKTLEYHIDRYYNHSENPLSKKASGLFG